MQKSKFFFLSYITLIFIIFIIPIFISPVNCETVSVAVSGANLEVNVDGLPDDDNIHFEILDRYIENYDVLSTTQLDENTYQFESMFYINLTTNFFTSYAANEVFDIVSYNVTAKKYATVITTTTSYYSLADTNPSDYDINDYSVYFNEYDLSYSKLLSRGFSGDVTFNAQFTMPERYTFNVEKQEFELNTTSMIANTERLTVTSGHVSDIGNYNDVFYSQQISNLASNKQRYQDFDYEDAKIGDKLEVLGYTAKDTRTESLFENGMPYQDENLPITVGRDDIQNKDVYLSLMPEVYVIYQNYDFWYRDYITFDVEKGVFDWGYTDGYLPDRSAYPRHLDDQKRYIGWHVQNRNIQQSYLAQVRITSIVDFKLSQDYRIAAENPNLQLGDIYWNAFVTGEGFEIETYKSKGVIFFETVFGEYWYVWVILISIVVAGVYIYLKRTGILGSGGDRTFEINIGNRK
jgi:hypothetical protein